MGLSTMLSWLVGRPVDITDHVEIVLRQAEPEVLQRTEGLGGSMSTSQCLGYVEARAAKVVRRHVARVATMRSLDSKTEKRLHQEAMEAVVTAVCLRLRASLPVTLRAAA
jgi:hypothetical protein